MTKQPNERGVMRSLAAMWRESEPLPKRDWRSHYRHLPVRRRAHRIASILYLVSVAIVVPFVLLEGYDGHPAIGICGVIAILTVAASFIFMRVTQIGQWSEAISEDLDEFQRRYRERSEQISYLIIAGSVYISIFIYFMFKIFDVDLTKINLEGGSMVLACLFGTILALPSIVLSWIVPETPKEDRY